MAIPKYKREQINADVVTEKMDGAADAAAAAGHAGVAAAGNQLSVQQGQRTNWEIGSLADRLNDFSRGLDHYMSMDAEKMGTDAANKKLVKKQNAIRQIKSNPNLTPEQQHEAITKERVDVNEDFISVYGQAYNNAVKADYTNELVIQSAESAQYAAQVSMGDPEMFKEGFRSYIDAALEGAPDDASRLVTSRAYERAGVAMYKKLYTARAAQAKAEAKDRFNVAEQTYKDQYVNAVTRGDVFAADEAMTGYNANQASGTDAGYISTIEATDNIAQLGEIGEQEHAKIIFENATNAGQGMEVYYLFREQYESGNFDHWKPGKAETIMRSMKSDLNEKADLLTDEILTTLDEGHVPSLSDTQEVESYLPFLSASKQAKLEKAKYGAIVLRAFEGTPLTEREVMLTAELAKDDLDATEIVGLNKALDVTRKQLATAKKDNILLGAENGLYKLQPLTPETITAGLVKDRAQQAVIAAGEYNTAQKFFTENETTIFSDFVNNKATTNDEKIALIGALNASPRPDIVYAQLTKKGAALFTGVGGLMREGKGKLASQVLSGDQFLREGSITTDREELRYSVSEGFSNALFFSGAGDSEMAIKTVEAQSAYYALQDGAKSDGKIANSHIKDAIKAVMGESGEYNDMTFFAPSGTDPDDVEDYFDDLEAADPILGVAPEHTLDIIKDSQIVHVGGGEFMLFNDGVRLENPDQTTYIIKYIK